MLSLALNAFMSLITKSVEISRESVGEAQRTSWKKCCLWDARIRSRTHCLLCPLWGPQATSRKLRSWRSTMHYQVRRWRSGAGGQVRRTLWSLVASVFIVSLDTTLKPEDGSKDRAFHLMRSGKLEAAGGYQFLRKVTMSCSSHLSTEQFTSMFPNVSTCVSLLFNFPGDSQQQLCSLSLLCICQPKSQWREMYCPDFLLQ